MIKIAPENVCAKGKIGYSCEDEEEVRDSSQRTHTAQHTRG